MSLIKNAKHYGLENLNLRLRGLRYQGLPSENGLLCADVLTIWWAILTDVCVGLSEELLLGLLNRYRFNIPQLIATLDSLSLELRQLPQTEAICDFKRHVAKRLGSLTAHLTEVLERACQFDPASFEQLDTVLCFMKKVNFIDPRMERDTLTSYLAVEEGLEGPYTEEECYLFQQWFPKRTFEEFVFRVFEPRHGNGAVADVRTPGAPLLEKHRALGSDYRINYLCNCGSVYSDTWDLFKGSFDRCSRTVFVPKSYKTYRTISMEPATLMWYQQGVSYALRRWCKSRLSHRYQPEDQRTNRFLAKKGSITGSFSTIDLSAASDSVAWTQIQQWTRRSGLYRFLLLTRSVRTELPSGEIIPLRKFAPMGSALNFDIESLVFCAQCETALLSQGIDPITSHYRVYGDDIIIETRYVNSVIDRLTRNGYKVNVSKSFTHQGNHNYRESCGGFYLDGVNVTPTMISRKFSGYHIDPRADRRALAKLVPQLVDMANDLVGYPSARQLIVAQLLRLPHQLQPLFTSDFSGLWSSDATNFNHHLYYDEGLQCLVTRSAGFRTSSSIPEDQSEASLDLWLRLVQGRDRLTYPEDLVLLPRNTGATRLVSKVTSVVR